jgi:hypothetical protein
MAAPKRPVKKARQFWKSFAAEAPEMHRSVFAEGFDALRRAHSRVGELRDAADLPFLYEMTSEGNDLVLLFTPEWDRDRAAEIDWFVSLAPAIPKWKIHTRRQRKDCDMALDMLHNALNADARDARFSVVEVEGGVHITMHSRVWDEFTVDGRDGCVRFFLSHALGEQLMMDRVPTVALAPPAKSARLLTAEKMVKAVLKLVAAST